MTEQAALAPQKLAPLEVIKASQESGMLRTFTSGELVTTLRAALEQVRESYRELCVRGSAFTCTNMEHAADGAELAKSLRDGMKDIDTYRDGQVRPLNDHVKSVNAEFKKITAPMDAAKTHVDAELSTFARAEENRRRQEAERIRREQEAAAFAAAQAAQEAARLAQEAADRLAEEARQTGDQDTAIQAAVQQDIARESEARSEEILNTAIESTAIDTRMESVRSESGALFSAKKTWDFEVQNFKELPDQLILCILSDEKAMAAIKTAIKRTYSQAIKQRCEKFKEAAERGGPVEIVQTGIKYFEVIDANIR